MVISWYDIPGCTTCEYSYIFVNRNCYYKITFVSIKYITKKLFDKYFDGNIEQNKSETKYKESKVNTSSKFRVETKSDRINNQIFCSSIPIGYFYKYDSRHLVPRKVALIYFFQRIHSLTSLPLICSVRKCIFVR